MKKIGIIMEVNPFHNGHKYFLEQVKEIAQDNYIVCIITTTITQRGEISILDKKVKTELLLKNGVDLVVELPLVMANQGGKYYGYYNVKVLNELGVNQIIFGSESDDISTLLEQIEKPTSKKDFKSGYLKEEIGTLKSNDILGMSYIKAIREINPSISYKTIKRISGNYNDQRLGDDKQNVKICSATAIRNNLDKKEKLKNYLPAKSYDNLLESIDEQKMIELLLFQFLNTTNTDDIFLSENGQIIRKIKRVFEELKLSKNMDKYTIDTLASACADKNNSKHKIRRIFINIIFQITEEEVAEYIEYNEKYKILGFSKRYTKELKGNQKLFANYKKRDGIYNINDKVDKILNLYFNREFKFNYEKPVIK